MEAYERVRVMENLVQIMIMLPILLFSVVVHECAHGLAAEKLGDPTARVMGRITLNPLPHIDPIFSVVIPLFLLVSTRGALVFGGAKPVPINPMNFKDPRRDFALSSLAGPAANFTLALVGTVLFRLTAWSLASWRVSGAPEIVLYLAGFGTVVFAGLVAVNVLLGMFNLVPIPPMDGSRLLMWLLPREHARVLMEMERFGMFIVVLFLFIGFPILYRFIVAPVLGLLLGPVV